MASAACAVATSCLKKPQLNFNAFVPDAVNKDVAWIEVGVFPGACPENKAIAGGLPAEGEVTRIAFRPGDANPPPVGDLARGKYAFAAVARGADCGVLAGGCAVIDVSQTRDINVVLSTIANPVGQCVSGTFCDAARCVPGTDNGNPTIGAGCSLTLLGAGPLGDPFGFAGNVVSAPAIAKTDTGFLIAYRDYDPILGGAQLTLIPVDTGGGASPPQITTLPGRCVTSEEGDATGMAFDGANGLVALARAPCNGTGGVDLFQVNAAGMVTKSGFNGAGPARITLANAHALAVTPGGGSFLLAFTESGETHVVGVTDLAVAATAPPFGGVAPQGNGWIATSDRTVALVAEGTGAASDDGGAPDAGAGVASVRVQIVTAGTDLTSIPAPTILPGSFGSVAALGTRVFVATDVTTPGAAAGWRAFDLGNGTQVASDTFSTQGLGKALFTDVAMAKDRVFFAVEQPGAISLVAYDHASTTPTPLRSIFLPLDPRIPNMSNVRDGRVAIAASDTRVAVVWATAKSLGVNDSVGGYAVFACTTP